MSRQLLNLIQANQRPDKKRPKALIKAKDDEATVYLYDVIDDWYGIDSGEFVREVAALDVSTIHLRVDSPGGDVFAARAMQTALAGHKAKVIAHIDGLAASAATFLVMSADEIRMTDGAFFMIHKGWTVTIGNADDMRKQAQLLDKIDDSIAADYARRSGKDSSEIIDLMQAETWYSASEAKDAGFIDAVVDISSSGAVENRHFNVSAYQKAPKAYTEPEPKPTPSPEAVRAHLERRLSLFS